MAKEERHVLALGEHQAGLRLAATSGAARDGHTGTPAPLDPLVRALDQAVIRSAQTGFGSTAMP
jgi:hypothetical protein